MQRPIKSWSAKKNNIFSFFTHQKLKALHLPDIDNNKMMLLPALIWAGALIFFSTGGQVSPPKLTSLLEPDKLAHAVAYFILASLLAFGFARSGMRGLQKHPILWAIGISSLFGFSLEIVQYLFFPGRLFELYDILANIIGSVACVLLSSFLIK
ncbi:VanZ family protein [Phaeodactylibacter xiamenensis]|jgi:VanZ family protein|uniref:VanZ family protein n=2 Tax=Phaeodactylibacter xiamenensis TaxID=1524460 RepID=UPI003BAB87A4